MKQRKIKQRIRRFLKSSIGLNIQIFAFAIIFILFLPTIILLLPLLIYISDRQKLKAADRFHCITCGHILGQLALDLADREWNSLYNEILRLTIQRRTRTVYAICVHCSTCFTYSEQAKTFTMLNSPES
jgi:hypothetical protein